jgi:hypothetical protein
MLQYALQATAVLLKGAEALLCRACRKLSDGPSAAVVGPDPAAAHRTHC